MSAENVYKVAAFGLGSMGYGIANSASKAGHLVWGIDINQEQIESFRNEGGQTSTLAEAAPELDAVIIVVLNAAQTESVLFGDEGIVALLKPGAVVIALSLIHI